MLQSEQNSSPLSITPSSPKQATHPSSVATTAQPEVESLTQLTHASSVETQQVLASDSVSTAAPTSSMGAKRAQKPCNKRTREEDSDSDDAFGTPPPKRTSRETTATANGKTAIKKASPSQKLALKKPMSKKTATKKPAPAPPASSSRPSRNRKAPERLEDLQEKSKPKPLPNKKGPSKIFDPVYITTNSNSRLVKADIYVC